MLNAIYNNIGEKIAGDKELPEKIAPRPTDGNFPFIEGNFTYYKLSDGNVSLICQEDKPADIKNGDGHITKNDFLRNLLSGATGSDIKKLCSRFSFRFDEPRRVYAVSVPDSAKIDCENLEEVFESADMSITMLPNGLFAFICSDEDNDANESAGAISATFCELSTDCGIGVSCRCENAGGIAEAYSQAAAALKAGQSASYTGGIWFFAQLLPEMLLSSGICADIPEIRKKAEQISNALDTETVELLNGFFRNSLNISETARICFLHRNTLIYRLDKIQKDTGFDARIFDEAVALRLLIAAHKYIK